MRPVRFDAPFWALVLAGVMLVGSFGLFGLAAAAQEASRDAGVLVIVDDS